VRLSRDAEGSKILEIVPGAVKIHKIEQKDEIERILEANPPHKRRFSMEGELAA
jgi:hypothetical protein